MNKKWWITQATFLKERASREEELAASPPQPARRTGAAREGPAEHPPGTVGACVVGGVWTQLRSEVQKKKKKKALAACIRLAMPAPH